MGNSAGSSVSRRRYQGHHPQPPARPTQPPTPSSQPEITGNQYVIAASTAYPSQFPNANLPQYNPYPSYHPAAPSTISYPRDPRGRYPGAMAPHLVNQNVEHQKAVTIRNDVNIKKETVRLEPDEENPGKFLVAFTFDANVAGSITVIFFAKEGVDCDLVATREDLFKPVSVTFQQGLGQKFRQPSGTGIDFSMLENTELMEDGIDMGIYPLVVKAEAYTTNQSESEENSKANFTKNSQITLAVFENREKGDYQVRVMKQILWVNGMRYELQEIYGIGNAVDDEQDENDDPGKECVVCLSEPRDTTVLPCRHMCLCSGCAKVLCFQTNRCPICRQPVERLLEIKVNNGTDD